jgi:hypothetical protein
VTAARVAQLRFLANFAAYHVPGAGDDRRSDADRAQVRDADAGDDMLELCDAVGAELKRADMSERRSSELLAALKGILAARPELWGDQVVNGRTVLSIDASAADAADAAIAKAEGRE